MLDSMPAVIVQSGPPRPVEPERRMSQAEWNDYHQLVWSRRLDAHVHAVYFARVRGVLSWARFALELVVTAGSAGAVVTLIASFPITVAIWFSAACAVCSAVLQLGAVGDRVRLAADLAEAWTARAGFWDDAWRMVRGGDYLGPIAELARVDVELHGLEQKLEFIERRSWQREAQELVRRTDPLLIASGGQTPRA